MNLGKKLSGLYRSGRRSLGLKNAPHLYYLVGSDYQWVLHWVGKYVVSKINQNSDWKAHVVSSSQYLVDHILHYASIWDFLGQVELPVNNKNILIATVFHGDRSDQFPELKQGMDKLLEFAQIPTKILTASKWMENNLIDWGIPEEKVVRIPLGVDLKRFKPASEEQRKTMRAQFGIPDDAICIGSFHKDGDGFGEGLAPKLIKGPDVFLQVIERLHKHYKLHIFLTAPARGYVKQGLEKLGVSYTHKMLADFHELPSYYHLLDFYLVSSRVEGGPKGVLEGMASGVPVVSTKVGLAPDVIEHKTNGLLVDVEDVDGLVEAVSSLIELPDLRQKIIQNGLERIKAYDWDIIAGRYYDELYSPLLKEIGFG